MINIYIYIHLNLTITVDDNEQSRNDKGRPWVTFWSLPMRTCKWILSDQGSATTCHVFIRYQLGPRPAGCRRDLLMYKVCRSHEVHGNIA